MMSILLIFLLLSGPPAPDPAPIGQSAQSPYPIPATAPLSQDKPSLPVFRF